MSKKFPDQPSRRAPAWVRRGFTLLEVLVVIAIVATVLALALPALSEARKAAKSAECMSRLRELGSLVTMYTADSGGLFPSWLGDGPEYRNDAGRWEAYTFQVFSTLARQPWRDYTGLTRTSESLYCAANRWYPEEYIEGASPDFVLSASVFAEVAHFDPGLPERVWKSRLGGKVQRIEAAAFPSSKVGVLELFVWHGFAGPYCDDCDFGKLHYYQSDRPGSLWFMDGHVEQRFATDALPYVYRYPIWPYMPYGTTAWGIAGRDIP